jgi:hypothetical protein
MSRELYVRALLALLRGLPQTAARRPSPADRGLAAQWFEAGVPLTTIEAAFLLTVARRSTRPAGLPPLPAIRSLAYFVPVVEELRLNPPDPGYLAYLRSSARRDDQISTDSGER